MDVVTEVPARAAKIALLTLVLLVLSNVKALSQQEQVPAASTNKSIQPEKTQNAEKLYLKLRSIGLDPAKVFRIREASFDHDQIHIMLDDGTIAFTEDVDERVTGAFFIGEGEVLIVPPDQAERASMSLFTGAAVLEEKFNSAYFRFNDDTYADLQVFLRPTDEAKDFAATWDSAAHNLAEWDALRLFMTFSQYLPIGPSSQPSITTPGHPGDRFLHARLQGVNLGPFDVYYDTTVTEQIAVAQQKTVDGIPYYNVWTSFATTSPASSEPAEASDELVIRSYRIRAEVKPPTTVQARAQLQIEIHRGGSRSVLFELSRYLKVNEVKMDGQPLQYIQNQALEGTQLARRGNDILAVVFPQPLQAGQSFGLSFNYSGDVLSEAGGGLLYVGARGTWYPNRGLAAANFDLQYRYPTGWTLLATGKRAIPDSVGDSEQNTSQQQQTSRWVTERPIPVAGFNLGRYEKATARADGVDVETYATAGVERNFPKQSEQVIVAPQPAVRPDRGKTVTVTQPPPSPARNAQAVADAAARTVSFYSQRFDAFPYDKLQLTQMPGPLSQGWPGLVFLSSFAFLTKEERASMHLDAADTILSQQITAHETAHQWWGDLVYWRGYRDQWISEGLANYCSLMLLESENPAAFKIVMQNYREALLQRNKNGTVLKDAGPVTLGVRLSSSEFPDGYDAISYGRGTWLFHMLRQMLNNAEPGSRSASSANSEPFVLALRRVRERYAGRAVTARQVLQVFAEDLPPSLRYEGRKSLEWFYESWINGTALPRIELQGVKLTAKGSSLSASGTVLQKDAPKDLVTSVPLYGILSANRRIFVGRVFADGLENSFRIMVPLGVKRIVADPDGTVLSNPH